VIKPGEMGQTIGARRGVGSVLTYRVFPGNKAGEKPWSHRKPYKPKSNRATSSKKPEARFEPLTSLPRNQMQPPFGGSPFRPRRRSGLIVKLELHDRSNGL